MLCKITYRSCAFSQMKGHHRKSNKTTTLVNFDGLFIRQISRMRANTVKIAVRRNDYIVCEATVDGQDTESGQYTAALKQAEFGGAKDPEVEANRKPRVGDEVIVSPFPSSRDLRMDGYNPLLENQQPSAEPKGIPEIEGILTPVP